MSKLTLKHTKVAYRELSFEEKLQVEREKAVRLAKRHAQKARAYIDAVYFTPRSAKTDVRF